MIEQPIMVRIFDITKESPGVKTLFFKSKLNFEPGQFIMVWIPLLDEKPFTISYFQEELAGISVLKKGLFTNALHNMKKGDKLGIRGPYGRGFSIPKTLNSCVVGGGIGMASLATLTERLGNVTIVQGTKTASEIIYRERFKNMNICTEDGSIGFKGTTVDLFVELLKKQSFQRVYACGPEKMMYRIFELCNSRYIECEVSLDRYIKCGFGVCGQCDCSGQRICIDGPVFSSNELSNMKDFGKTLILKNGKRAYC